MIRLTPFAGHETPEGATDIEGFEPWHLEALWQAAGEKPSDAISERLRTAQLLFEKGPAGLSKADRAFWYAYQSEAKCPLVGEAKEAEEAVVSAHLKAFKAAKADEAALSDAMEKAEHSLVSRFWDIGFFATKGVIKLTALPDWVKGAVVVNTKGKSWELAVVGNSPIVHLRHWAPAALSGGIWTGHRFRVRQAGLPDIRQIHHAVSGLRSILEVRSAK
jgi:hypothetical protein